ncbi:hypothetical protein CDV25_04315 [Helicobacter apodemus]|uniref:Uncharacterized protein n=1 Tax=Helicobacter apodemus TaxID=135569 RepID=A0A2U8FD49_9HELI|nr:hypothetical protein CDV25_04315 [Helicobacter apodemus]
MEYVKQYFIKGILTIHPKNPNSKELMASLLYVTKHKDIKNKKKRNRKYYIHARRFIIKNTTNNP